MESYLKNYDANTIIKYLRKVLQEIDSTYVDSSIKCAFIMKRYLEHYELMDEKTSKLVLTCFLKDIGTFYLDKFCCFFFSLCKCSCTHIYKKSSCFCSVSYFLGIIDKNLSSLIFIFGI